MFWYLNFCPPKILPFTKNGMKKPHNLMGPQLAKSKFVALILSVNIVSGPTLKSRRSSCLMARRI